METNKRPGSQSGRTSVRGLTRRGERELVALAKRELDRCIAEGDQSDERYARQLRKLEADLRRAENDAGWLQKQLDDAMD